MQHKLGVTMIAISHSLTLLGNVEVDLISIMKHKLGVTMIAISHSLTLLGNVEFLELLHIAYPG